MNENEHLENRKYCEKNGYKKNRYGQAGAELGQAQLKLGLDFNQI